MKKRLPLIFGVLCSTLGITSCQNENDSLDKYEITEVGVKKNQILKYEMLPFIIDVMNLDDLHLANSSFAGTPILFKGNNYFTKKETQLFAKKYSYAAEFNDESSICLGTRYRYYNKITSYGYVYVSLKNPEQYSGTYTFASVGDLTEYTVKPKDTSKESFTVFVAAGIVTFELIKLL